MDRAAARSRALGPDEQDALWHYQGLATVAFAVSPRSQFTFGRVARKAGARIIAFAVSPRSQFTFGLGARGIRFLEGDRYTHLALHYAAEFFPVRPFHAWAQGEVSFWTGTWATEVEAGLGLLIHRLEIFGGYRQFRLLGVEFAGPQVGVMAWF